MADGTKNNSLSISQLKTASDFAHKRKELDYLRQTEYRDWALNRAFYRGDQWVFWSRTSSQVETLPVQDGEKPNWKVRLTSNQIQPGVNHHVALLTKTKPIIKATPDSPSYRDLCAAQVASDLYDYWRYEFDLQSKTHHALMNADLDQGWWEICWDPHAGKAMQVVVGPDGKAITDTVLSDLFLDELQQVAEQRGMDPDQLIEQHTKTIYVGELDVRVPNGQNVYIDPTVTDYTKAKWAIIRHPMDIDQIFARFGKWVTPDATPTDSSTPLMFQSKKDPAPKTLRNVYCMYIPPSAVIPKGRCVYWLEDPNEILEDKPWNYPFTEIPLVKFPGNRRPDSVYDEPITTMARPLQKELNRTLSQIVQHKDLTIKPQMLAPVGSLRQQLTDEPGAVFEYQPIQGLMPEWRPTPNLPNTAFSILEDIQQRIDKVYNAMPSNRDSLPSRIDAGYGIEMLMESVADQLSPTIQRLEEALARAGKLMVLLAKEYYTETRLLKIRGDGGSIQVRRFRNSDLNGGFSFRAEAGSGLPRSRAGREQRILDLLDKQVLTPQQAMKYLDLADLKGIQQQLQADEDQAYREHEKIIEGQPVNVLAMQDAMKQASQIINDPNADPDGDGQPDSPQEKAQAAQQMIKTASLQPTDYEDWETHVQVHALFMKSPEFEQLDPKIQDDFRTHYLATYQKVIAVKRAMLSLDPKVQPKVNYTMRSTASTPVATALLNDMGVQVNEQQVASPPLQTQVMEEERMNVNEQGTGGVQDMQALLEMQQAEEEHHGHLLSQQQMMQQQSQQADQNAQQHAMKMAQTAQALEHQRQLHQVNVAQSLQQQAQRQRQADEMHAVRVRQAKQKPSNSNGGQK